MYRIVIETQQLKDREILLTPEQNHYLRRVLRLKIGDKFISLERGGKTWLSQLTEVGANPLHSLVENNELPVPVTLLVALPKGQGFEEIVRSCTELGASCFVPLLSERTLLKPSEQKLARWRKIAQEAAEQSERQVIPLIRDPSSLERALAEVADSGTNCYICVTRQESKSLLWYLEKQPLAPTVIMTGPEGGWTVEEVEKAIAHNFQPVSLGGRILRAVTAPVMALSLVAATLEGN
jgi:16S rRNA (uracil1498-N3)-methyltransferase